MNAASDDKRYSLLDPSAMGGIIGGDGYSFQERYIVCHIPGWLKDPHFVRFMHEATGDVDIVFERSDKFDYDHVQVKDHNITKGEFIKVVKGFIRIDKAMSAGHSGKGYRKFTLATPYLSQTVKSLADALSRFREAEKLYDEKDRDFMLRTTNEDLIEKIDGAGLAKQADFVLNKLHFEIGLFDFNDNNICKRQFISILTEHPLYKEYLNHILHPVYSRLLEEVSAHRGKVLEQVVIHGFIKMMLVPSSGPAIDNVLHFHNWTVEKYDLDATLTLDWSKHFDRTTRRVPDANVWDKELVPGLSAARQELASSTSNRHIIFRGKCTLSAGFALGMAFPEVGNWSFELIQYPQVWRSDAEKVQNYELRYETVDPIKYGLASENWEIVIIFNITGHALEDVVEFLKNRGISVKQLVMIQPSQAAGNLSIQNDSEAVSLASASKDIIKKMVTKYKAKKIHFFYYGPLGLSIFLGQKLTAVGQIQVYEFQDPGYKESCLIKT